jgi:hypothetical protein
MPTVDEDVLRDLMQRSTEDVHARSEVASRIVAHHRRTHRRVITGTAVTGALAVAAASTALFATSPGTATLSHSGHAIDSAKHGTALLYQLASASADVPALSGRYVVLSETDTETGLAGESKRTTVEDVQTGASTTYQGAFPVDGVAPSSSYTSEPSVLTDGVGHSNTTAAYYASLPTDPAALRGQLLAMAKEQEASANAALQQKPNAMVTEPTLTDDDSVYQEADEMLWSPVVGPSLRSALYKVLATTPGVTVVNNATDPSGRAAIKMQRTYTGVAATDITYEDPATGAVLAQVWSDPEGVITAVYQPITGTDTIPHKPYAG